MMTTEIFAAMNETEAAFNADPMNIDKLNASAALETKP